jgi:hypothetical protein
VPVRALIGPGLVLVGVGLLLMRGLTASSGWTHLIPGFIVAGLGVGLTNPALASTAISVVRRERSGVASGINSTSRQVGIATGIAGLGAALQNQIEARFLDTPSGSHVPARALDGVVQGISAGRIGDVAKAAPPQFRAQIAHDASVAFFSGFNEILLIGAGIALFGSLAALILVRGKDFVASAPAEQQAGQKPVLQPAG